MSSLRHKSHEYLMLGDRGPMAQPDISTLRPKPITFAVAKSLISRWHSTHKPPQGWRFGVGVSVELDTMRGERCRGFVAVVIAGRPTGRFANQTTTLEITRIAGAGVANAAGVGTAAIVRAARALGFWRVITYTEGECSWLRGLGFEHDGETKPGEGRWGEPRIVRQRWIQELRPPQSTLISVRIP